MERKECHYTYNLGSFVGVVASFAYMYDLLCEKSLQGEMLQKLLRGFGCIICGIFLLGALAIFSGTDRTSLMIWIMAYEW